MKWIKQTLLALFFIGVLVSCEYEFIEIATPPPPDPGDTIIDTVFFAAQIEPIFESSQCTNCHNGGLSLNLKAGFAYESIYSNSTVVAKEPEASTIYTYPHPVTGTHNTKYGTVDDANLVYSWVAQGAMDN